MVSGGAECRLFGLKGSCPLGSKTTRSAAGGGAGAPWLWEGSGALAAGWGRVAGGPGPLHHDWGVKAIRSQREMRGGVAKFPTERDPGTLGASLSAASSWYAAEPGTELAKSDVDSREFIP